MRNVLEVSSSARMDDSVSRVLGKELVAALQTRHPGIEYKQRDLNDGVPFVDAAWVEANFTPADARSARQRAALSTSDKLVAELQDADIVVIGAPIYNFSIPASLKAWIDMISRAGLTFGYTDSGPRGLLEDKKAWLVVASGGVAVGSKLDFATPYLKHALAFVGITDVDVIAADGLVSNEAESLDKARQHIAELVHVSVDAA